MARRFQFEVALRHAELFSEQNQRQHLLRDNEVTKRHTLAHVRGRATAPPMSLGAGKIVTALESDCQKIVTISLFFNR